ncbi:MAG: hypothetical protein LBP22_12080 [Deltaproteobacteria bacterium]|jgi:hypothetical protein|nr:hypothetical protein [Deltaproteobacteria bacterium]
MDADRGDLMQACAKIEKCCDNCGYSSRVSTKGAVVGSIAPGILSGGLGFLGLAVGKVAHLVATFNPDYEIDRNIITNTVTVTYKK